MAAGEFKITPKKAKRMMEEILGLKKEVKELRAEKAKKPPKEEPAEEEETGEKKDPPKKKKTFLERFL